MTVSLDELTAAVKGGLPDGDETEVFEWFVTLGCDPYAVKRVLDVVLQDRVDPDNIPDSERRGVQDIALCSFAIGLVAGRNERTP